MLSHIGRDKAAASLVVFLVVLTALTVLFYQTVYVEQQTDLEEKRQTLFLRQQDLARLETFLQRHGNDSAAEEALKKHTEWSRRLLPDELRTGDFLSDLQGYMLRSKVKVIGLTPGVSEQKEGFCRQRIEMTVEGDYFQLLDFIRLLEQQDRFVIVENISGQVQESGILRGHIVLYIFARIIEKDGAGK